MSGLWHATILVADEKPNEPVDASPARSAIDDKTVGDDKAPSNVADAPGHKAQKRDVDAVVVLLVLTVVVIVISFAGLLIWGRRVRRLAREPLKTVPLPDQLWYLRHRAPTSKNAGPESPESDRPSAAQDDDQDQE